VPGLCAERMRRRDGRRRRAVPAGTPVPDGAGQPATPRVAWRASSATNTTDIVAWLVYRDNYAGLGAEDPELIDARGEGRSLDFWDNPAGAGAVTFNAPSPT